MATFPNARKFSSYLVRAKFCPIEQIVGSHKCKDKSCERCLNVQEISCFTISVINERYKINYQFDFFMQVLHILTKNLQPPGTLFFSVPGNQPAKLCPKVN